METMIRAVYRLPPGYTFDDLFEDHAALLRSEGLDPTWRGFDKPEPEH